MDLAYVNKFGKENNGVNYLLVRQDLFYRTVQAKRMKTKDCQETVTAFSTMITKKIARKRFGWTRGPKLPERLKTFCAAEGTQVCLTMSETKATFANVQYDHWKFFFTFTWKIMDTSIYLNLSLP